MSVALATHYLTTGQPELLARYLRGLTEKFVAIYHPFPFSEESVTRVQWYMRGKLVEGRNVRRPHLNGSINYVVDLLVTLYLLARRSIVIDVFVGGDALNALGGILLRGLGRTRFVILYSIDLPIKRFGNPVLNILYHKLNAFCASRCNATWDLSPRMNVVRRAYSGGRNIDYQYHLVVPSVYRARRPYSKSERENVLFFVGHLREDVDLSVVIRSMKIIRHEIPDIRLIVVGAGPQLMRLQELAKNLDLANSVMFCGHLESDEKIERIASRCALGVAPYAPNMTGIAATGDSMKLKFYAALGLPSITTSVPAFASVVESAKAGLVVPLSERAFAEAALTLLGNPAVLDEYSRNATQLARQYEPETVFGGAIVKSLSGTPHSSSDFSDKS